MNKNKFIGGILIAIPFLFSISLTLYLDRWAFWEMFKIILIVSLPASVVILSTFMLMSGLRKWHNYDNHE